MVAAAVVGSAVVGAGTSAISGKMAADAQSKAADRASSTEMQMFQQNREDLAPYRQVGADALNILSNMYTGRTFDNETGQMVGSPDGFDYSRFTQSPDYQFAYDQGLRAVNQSLAQRGLGGAADSGAAMKALTRFGQGLASQQFGNYKNSLQALAGVGQSATTQTGAMGQQVAGRVAQNQLSAGDARASSYLNTGQAINQLGQSLGGYQIMKQKGML